MTHDSIVALPEKEDSCGGALKRLMTEYKKSPVEIMKALCSQTVEIVLTAHPTEVNRRTIIDKHHRVKKILQQEERPDLVPYEIRQLNKQLKAEIASIWESDELMRSKPSPVDEARSGLAIVENVLWNAVPQFLRKLDDVVLHTLGKALPLDITPIKIASWMGGDRDGNPNVTPSITFKVSMESRKLAAELFLKDINLLHKQISITMASAELKAATNNAREPYRYLLQDLNKKLQETIEWTDAQLNGLLPKSAKCPLIHTSEISKPLMLLHRSLVETGNHEIADGLLADTIRRLAAFGLSLLPLDIRQESTRHSEALDAITKHLGIGSYLEWDETKRRNWIVSELVSKRPLLPRRRALSSFGFSSTAVDTLETFELAASLDGSSLGAYVISQCQQASDILAVMLLQQDAGVISPIRVVPLFETLDDLERSASTVDALLSIREYRERINNHQEIMVGYSDSAKDAGRLAAAWAQYNAQEAMIKVGNKHGVDLTFFHGKGGTVGRGGNPALYQAIIAHPPNTINGRFRVTEQGEMITQNLGQEAIAERTLDLFTAGVLVERFKPRPEPKKEWRDMMERLSEISCNAYRKVVRGEERFVPYFRAATPELELAGLNVGSRPAKRNPKGGVESLRAIPWVFAWTQTRLNLPTWLGVGDALAKEYQSKPQVLKEMYKDWPWFRTLIDLVEMILVKSDERIAANYDEQLVLDKASLSLGKEMREKLTTTAQAVLAISGHAELQANNPILLRSLAVRNPYVDPLNIIQADVLRR
jgi:phosphoenolpyruvate carboxylase